MRTGHLFAGGGGGLYADLILGHTPVFAVEWDAYACAVLRSRAADGWFPGLRVHEGDVRLWDPSEYAGAVDCIHAGFPCQDISAAGKGAGITGERSGLYVEVMRAIDAIRPAWVMLENSPLIRTRGRHVVIADLVARGYSWRDGILSAANVGAPHKRDRWWCLARRADAESNRWSEGRPESTGEQGGSGFASLGGEDLAHARRQRDRAIANPIYGHAEWYRTPERKQPIGSGADVANPNGIGTRSGKSGGPEERNKVDVCGADVADTSSGRCSRTHGGQMEQSRGAEAFRSGEDVAESRAAGLAIGQGPDGERTYPAASGGGWWSVEPDVGRLAHGMAHRSHQIRALGNGQVPLCAAAAWKILGGP